MPTLKIVIPSDGHYASYYDQAISKTAPHPAAARLWEEYLYSSTARTSGCRARPGRSSCQHSVKEGTVDKAAFASLPAAPSRDDLPDGGSADHGQGLVAQKWSLWSATDDQR